jgi:hypothetical protein
MTSATSKSTTRELNRRISDGIEVRLLWSPDANRVMVAVHDSRSEESFELPVAGADALDAFHHPYAYAARRPIPADRLPATEKEAA